MIFRTARKTERILFIRSCYERLFIGETIEYNNNIVRSKKKQGKKEKLKIRSRKICILILTYIQVKSVSQSMDECNAG